MTIIRPPSGLGLLFDEMPTAQELQRRYAGKASAEMVARRARRRARLARAGSALAALAAIAVAVLFFTRPANAEAPKAPGDNLCTTVEWRTPTNWPRCTTQLKTKIGNAAACVQAPTPSDPTGGLPGMFAQRPDTSLRPGISGRYSEYGWAGYQLEVYGTGCASTVLHPGDAFASQTASWSFTGAATVLAAAGRTREAAYQPGSVWTPMDGFVASTTERTARWIWQPAGGFTIILVGLGLLLRARHGRMSHALYTAGWAIVVVALTTAVLRWPTAATHTVDQAAAGGLTAVQSVIGPADESVPTSKCVLGPEACKDNRPAAVRASDQWAETVLYRNWLRGLLGSADSNTARTYGPALYDATAFRWDEAREIQKEPGIAKVYTDLKAERWRLIAAQIKETDPAAYRHMQGANGGDRIGVGVFTLLSAGLVAGFDMLSSLVIILSFGVFRFAVLFLPAIAAIGILERAAGPLRWLVNRVTHAVINIVTYGLGAALYLAAVGAIFRSTLPDPVQLLAVALTGVLSYLMLRPIRRIRLSLGWTPDRPEKVSLFAASRTVSERIRRYSADPHPTAPSPPRRVRPEAAPTQRRPPTTATGRQVATSTRPAITARRSR